MKYTRVTTVLMLVGLCMFNIGCQAWTNSRWIAPAGPMNYQQANAVIHDPFPQGDLGPEDLASRPPDYQNPLPLAVRNQMKREVTPWLGP